MHKFVPDMSDVSSVSMTSFDLLRSPVWPEAESQVRARVSKAHSTFQPADKCPVQPCGESKNPLIEAGPRPLYRCIPLQSFL